MNTTTKRLSPRVVKDRFNTDALFSFYDFAKGEVGDVLISWEFIEKFKNKRLDDLMKLSVAEELLDMVEDYPVYEDNNYNFTIFLDQGKVRIELGHDLSVIKDNLEEYKKYLFELREYGLETYIEFSL